jgi:hypothetical protein
VQVTTNQRMITRRARLGRWANIIGFVLLIGGFIISLQSTEYVWVAYATLFGALILMNVAKANTLRFGGRPRVDEAITTNLKTLDHKHHLYHYVDGLPVDHLLVSPFGLYVFETRPQIGRIRVEGDKWRREGGIMRFLLAFSEGGLGKPSRDLQRGITGLREFLVERLGEAAVADVPIDGVVVFTHPRARLHVEEPVVPVVSAKELRPIIRRREGRARLSPDLIRRVSSALNEQAEAGSLSPAKA